MGEVWDGRNLLRRIVRHRVERTNLDRWIFSSFYNHMMIVDSFKNGQNIIF